MRKVATFVALAAAVGVGLFLGEQVIRSDPGTTTPHVSLTPRGPRSGPTFFLAGKVQPAPKGKIYWGAYRENAPYQTSLVTGLESEVRRRPAILMWYQEWAGQPDFPAADASWLFERGIVPMITWEPWKPPAVFATLVVDQPQYRLARIAGGAFDAYIRHYAEEIRAYGGPVMLRPMHEMDGFWYPWCGTVNGNKPSDYVAAWRHMHDIFQQVGATNVTWVWSVNHVSVPSSPDNQFEHYWPGPSYVDWVAVSGFNWGLASPLSIWKGFPSVIGERYQGLLRYRKPIVLTETGAPEVGGNKAQWILQAFTDILDEFPRLKAVIWYDKRDTPLRDWRIDSTPESLDAFRQAIAQPRILSADAAQATTITR